MAGEGAVRDDRPRTLALAAGFGAAWSSCSYAAAALARSLFRKGASFTAAMAFEVASTSLVVELGVILALLIGWQFTLAEFIGGPIMIVLLALVFRLFCASGCLTRPRPRPAGAGWLDGRACRYGHDHPGRREPVAAASVRRGVHLGLAHLRDGMGGGHLNIIFLVLAAALCYRFARSGGIPMLKMMGGGPEHEGEHHDHASTSPPL